MERLKGRLVVSKEMAVWVNSTWNEVCKDGVVGTCVSIKVGQPIHAL